MKAKKITVALSALIILIVPIVIITINGSGKTYIKQGIYFDTYNEITVYSRKDYQKLDEVFEKLAYYDTLFDRRNENSDIYRLNNSEGKPVSVSEDTYSLLKTACEYCEESNNAVDITIAPVIDLWGFGTDEAKEVPTDSELNEALMHVDYTTIEFRNKNTVVLSDKDTKIDVGFIAKGYIADCIKEYMISIGIKKAVISLGGNILVIGQKSRNTPFVIGIKDPMNPSEILKTEEVKDESVVTSGTYERYIEIDGKKYHHILDTNTGFPADNGINGVTVKAKNSVDADALSTICLILGEKESEQILKNHNATAIFY